MCFLLFILGNPNITDNNPSAIFYLIYLYRNRVFGILDLPNFVHSDPLGQQITIFWKVFNSILVNYNLMKFRVNKSGKIFRRTDKKCPIFLYFLSYNNEALMPIETIKKIMKKYGHYSCEEKSYQRFRANKTANRNHKFNATTEYLHILEKQ